MTRTIASDNEHKAIITWSLKQDWDFDKLYAHFKRNKWLTKQGKSVNIRYLRKLFSQATGQFQQQLKIVEANDSKFEALMAELKTCKLLKEYKAVIAKYS